MTMTIRGTWTPAREGDTPGALLPGEDDPNSIHPYNTPPAVGTWDNRRTRRTRKTTTRRTR